MDFTGFDYILTPTILSVTVLLYKYRFLSSTKSVLVKVKNVLEDRKSSESSFLKVEPIQETATFVDFGEWVVALAASTIRSYIQSGINSSRCSD